MNPLRKHPPLLYLKKMNKLFSNVYFIVSSVESVYKRLDVCEKQQVVCKQTSSRLLQST